MSHRLCPEMRPPAGWWTVTVWGPSQAKTQVQFFHPATTPELADVAIDLAADYLQVFQSSMAPGCPLCIELHDPSGFIGRIECAPDRLKTIGASIRESIANLANHRAKAPQRKPN